MTDTITLAEFIDAIEKNGLPQAFSTMWETDTGERVYISHSDYSEPELQIIGSNHRAPTIGAACAMGQGYINLGIIIAWDEFDSSNEEMFSRIETSIVSMNDEYTMSIPDIVTTLRSEYVGDLDMEIPVKSFDYSPYLPEKVGAE